MQVVEDEEARFEKEADAFFTSRKIGVGVGVMGEWT